ncbi:MAG: respiratory nitrate reductase subunit gamma [Acidobacteria bacterium]|jgi:nitrate reductase gamma subunit|nr:respiratory nitrate reductase subunit gamma [Acidobacteriota bacterium]
MTAVTFGVLYLAAFLFCAGCVVRAVMYAKQPLHLRWELYPVPHEEPHRVEHGGSYFEELNWWKGSRKSYMAGELKVMVPEMLFLKALFEFNRPMWIRSFPFHFGLYLMIGTCGLLLLAALLGLWAPALAASGIGVLLHVAYVATGIAGTALAMLGAILLLIARLTDSKLKTYTVAGDIFNLLFFIAAFGALAAGYLSRGEGAPGMAAITGGLLRFRADMAIPPLMQTGLILCGLLAAYIPCTHMSHFIGKYFTYHSVRWNDAVNMPGSAIEKKLMEYLTYRPNWAAPHMTADGKRSWAEVATTNPWQGEKK